MLGMISMSCKFRSEEKAIAADQVPESEQPMDWFKEAKFGLFIHWEGFSAVRQLRLGKPVRNNK
jgi:hypothetical protein